MADGPPGAMTAETATAMMESGSEAKTGWAEGSTTNSTNASFPERVKARVEELKARFKVSTHSIDTMLR